MVTCFSAAWIESISQTSWAFLSRRMRSVATSVSPDSSLLMERMSLMSRVSRSVSIMMMRRNLCAISGLSMAPASSVSTKPWMLVSGVFNSWDTLAAKSVRTCSSLRSSVMSSTMASAPTTAPSRFMAETYIRRGRCPRPTAVRAATSLV